MKYVMFAKHSKTLTHFLPVIFPNSLAHIDIAKMTTKIDGFDGYSVVSAGECNANLGAKCFGESTTLGLKADPERDSAIIAMNDYGGAFG